MKLGLIRVRLAGGRSARPRAHFVESGPVGVYIGDRRGRTGLGAGRLAAAQIALDDFAGVLVVLSLSSWLFDEAIFESIREFAAGADRFWVRAPSEDTWRALNWTAVIGTLASPSL